MIFFSSIQKKSIVAKLLKKQLLCLLTCALFILNTTAQTSASLQYINKLNGLTSNTVITIFEDSRGLIWIGTQDGLNMYDGQTIKQYYLSDYIPELSFSNVVQKITEDAFHNLLIATKAGIIKFSWQTKQFSLVYKNDYASFGNSYPDLFVDKEKNIWVNERVRLKKFDAEFHLLKTWNLHDSTDAKYLSGPLVTTIGGEDAYQNIWLCDSGLVYRINAVQGNIDSTVNISLRKPGIIFKNFNSLHVADTSIWVLENNLLFLHFNISLKLIGSYALPEKTFPGFFTSVAPAPDGTLCLATLSGGIFLLDSHTSKIQNFKSGAIANDSLASNYINCVIKDAAGNTWIGTDKGVNQWKTNTSFFHILNFNGAVPQPNQAYEIRRAFANNDYLFVFTTNEVIKVSLLNNSFEYFVDKGKTFNDNVFYTGAFAYKNRWLVSRRHDVEFLDIKNNHLVFSNFISPHPAKLDSSNVFSFYKDREENIWLGLYNDAGIVCWHPDNKFDVYSQKDTGRFFCSLRHYSYAAEDDDGNIWMGYDKGGLLIFDKQQQKFKQVLAAGKNSANNISVLGIVNDKHGSLWLATNAGLIRYIEKEKLFLHLTRTNGLPSNSVQSIIADGNENIWLGFEGALAVINIADNKITTYTSADGLPDENLQLPFYDTTSHNLFFCTDNSVIYFNPLQIKKMRALLKPLITSFEVMGKEQIWTAGKKVKLPYAENYLAFNFSAPNFINASENEYACKLTGADKNWNYMGNHHFANYSQLQPGNYIFSVKARVSGGMWQEVVQPVYISILKPFWLTTWFWVICALAVIAVVFAFMYISWRNKFEKQMLAQSIRDKIAGDLHDDIGSTLSSIAILSELAKRQSSQTLHFLARIKENTLIMQETMSDIVWTINPKNDRFGNIIQRMTQFASEILEAKNIEVTFKSDESLASLQLPMEKRKNFYLIFKEAINNCARHSQASQVNISILNNEQYINMTIADNGKGFNAAANYSGNGMTTMKKRAADLKAEFKITAAANKGTVITLCFTV